MTDVQKIWAVESGDYEQHGVDVLFTSEVLANQAAELMDSHSTRKEHTVYVYAMMDRLPIRVTHYEVSGRLGDTGEFVETRRSSLSTYSGGGPGIEIEDPFDSWDYAVPSTPSIRVVRWDGSQGSPDFVEVSGRNSDECYRLVVENLKRIARV